MSFEELGLINTKKLFSDALSGGYAIPAFNFYNMETLQAIIKASKDTKSPVILAVSESALNYMGDDMLIGMIQGLKLSRKDKIALHLDHGSSFDICKRAIKLGFSSVMIDASKLPFKENIKLSKKVVDFAHKYGVSVEAELGTLSGIEDENTFGDYSNYTDPAEAIKFIKETGTDSLAVAVGTSHGAYKRKTVNEKLRFDILKEIFNKLPKYPLVLHGASTIPQNFITTINKNGGNIKNALGIPGAQIKKAISMNICKVNIDSDSRLAFTAGVRESLIKKPSDFNPRFYLSAGKENIYKNCVNEINKIMNSANKI